MASENETVAEVLDDFAYLITLGNIGPNVATDVRNRIEASHGREVEELKKKCEEYERQPELMAETAKEALELLKAQDSKIAELRECLKEAVNAKCAMCAYRDSELEAYYDNGFKCDESDCEAFKWRKALEGGES